jgi:hypothetical protein
MSSFYTKDIIAHTEYLQDKNLWYILIIHKNGTKSYQTKYLSNIVNIVTTLLVFLLHK